MFYFSTLGWSFQVEVFTFVANDSRPTEPTPLEYLYLEFKTALVLFFRQKLALEAKRIGALKKNLLHLIEVSGCYTV